MKRFIILIVTALAFASCGKDGDGNGSILDENAYYLKIFAAPEFSISEVAVSYNGGTIFPEGYPVPLTKDWVQYLSDDDRPTRLKITGKATKKISLKIQILYKKAVIKEMSLPTDDNGNLSNSIRLDY